MVGYVCLSCATPVKPVYVKRGSSKLEWTGWMLFPLGVPYTIWRILSKYPVCRYCKQETLVKDNSAMGLRIISLAGMKALPKKEPKLADAPPEPDEPKRPKPDPNTW